MMVCSKCGETWNESVSCYITLLKWCVTASKNHKCWSTERIVEVQEDFLSVSWLWQVDGRSLGFHSTGNKDGGCQQQERINVWMDVFPWLFSLLCPTYLYALRIVLSALWYVLPYAFSELCAIPRHDCTERYCPAYMSQGLYETVVKCQCSDVKFETDIRRKCLILTVPIGNKQQCKISTMGEHWKNKIK